MNQPRSYTTRASRIALLVCLFVNCLIIKNWAQVNFHNIIKVEDKFNEMGTVFTAKNAVVEDSLGYLWIGSGKGLCKYSGSTINCYTHNEGDDNSIDGDRISFLMMDSEHLIWTAIFEKGINVFDITGKKIYDFEYRANNENSLLHNRVWGMWEDEDGYIWISYFYGGITRYDKKNDQMAHFTIDNQEALQKHRPRTVVAVEKHNTEPHTYWLATTVGLVKFNTRNQESSSFIFEKEIDTQSSESQYNMSKLKPVWARSMCKDSQGNLWLGTFGGLVEFDVEMEEYQVIRDIGDETLNIVAGVMNYNEEHIMLSFHKGLTLLNINTKELTVLSKVNGINPNHYLYGRMFRAENGCMYILNRAGTKRGIYKYCKSSDFVKDYRTGNYISNLIVTDNFIHYHRFPGQIESRNIRTGELTNYTFEIENGSTIRSMIQLSGDTILVSDFFHMYQYHPMSGLKRIKALSQSDVYRHESVFIDSQGDIWNGRQRDGLFVLDHQTKQVRHYNHESTPALVYQDYIVDFLEDEDDDIWIATEQGWTIFDKTKNETSNYLSKDVGAENALNFRTINALAQTEKGKIWIATASSGLLLWSKAEERILAHLNMKNGLTSNGIYDIEVDQHNNLWLATDSGISWVNSETQQIKNFGKEFGITGSVYTLDIENRKVYAGHHQGYYNFEMDELLSFERPLPEPVIVGFELYDRKQDSLLYLKNGISLSHDQNFFSFTYGSINFFDPHREKYQYRLKGIDRDWINDRGARKKEYTNIEPGNYEFQVRIKTESDFWTTPTKVKLVIRPAWYQTLWFKMLIGLITGLLTWTLIRIYINAQKRKLEVDKRFAQLETMILRSQMNPHFIFNSLNSIRYLFMKDEKENGLKYITKFAKLLRTTLNHGEHALVRLEDEIELTELFIQLEQLRFDDKFQYNPAYPKDVSWKEILIPPFVIQPIVENAFWHGLLPSKNDKKLLDISIEKVHNGFEISIEDNGVGLNVKSSSSVNLELNKTKSYGLNIIKERFELMNKNEKTEYQIEVKDSINNESGAMITIKIINS